MKAIIAVVVLGVVGTGIFIFINQDTTSVDIRTDESVAEELNQERREESRLASVGTIEDIIALGDVKCDYRAEVISQEVTSVTEGVMYHSNDKVRVDSVVVSDNLEGVDAFSLDSSMIIEDNVSYTWSSLGAVKMDLDAISQLESGMSEQYGDLFAGSSDLETSLLEQDFQYDCESWSVDSSVFELPAGVEFVDMIELMEVNMNQLEGLRNMMEDLEAPEPQ